MSSSVLYLLAVTPGILISDNTTPLYPSVRGVRSTAFSMLDRLVKEKTQSFLDSELELLYLGRRDFPDYLIGA